RRSSDLFPESYRNSFPPSVALRDAARLLKLSADNPIAIGFHRDPGRPEIHADLKIYHHGAPVALSRRVPLLENMGFRVISERTFEIAAEGGVSLDRKSTRLNSSHVKISYAVFCLKKK